MQEILGGKYVAVEKYNAQFFQRFRSGNIVELTVDFARVGCHLCFVCSLSSICLYTVVQKNWTPVTFQI